MTEPVDVMMRQHLIRTVNVLTHQRLKGLRQAIRVAEGSEPISSTSAMIIMAYAHDVAGAIKALRHVSSTHVDGQAVSDGVPQYYPDGWKDASPLDRPGQLGWASIAVLIVHMANTLGNAVRSNSCINDATHVLVVEQGIAAVIAAMQRLISDTAQP